MVTFTQGVARDFSKSALQEIADAASMRAKLIRRHYGDERVQSGTVESAPFDRLASACLDMIALMGDIK